MMYGGYDSRENLNCFKKVFILFELRRELLVNGEVRKFAFSRNFERYRHLEDVIGRSSRRMAPAVLENRHLRRQGRVTFGGAIINPGDDDLDLLRGQAPVIAKRSK